MEYRVLGEVGVVGPDGPVRLGGANQRRLLAILIARGADGATADLIANTLWPDAVTNAPRGRVQTVVSRLRRALGPAADDVATLAHGYRLDVDRSAVDAHRFEDLVEAAASAPREESVALYREAMALWHGTAFGVDRDLEPVVPVANRWEELRLIAEEQRLERMLELGRYQAALPDIEALVHTEPLREGLRGQLIRALYWTGRQVDSLEAYASYRDLLGQDLGLDPSPELQELHEAVLRGEVPASVARPTRPGPAADGPLDEPTTPAELERQGWERMWECDHEGSVAARQKAYVRLLRDGDRPGAARLAIWLGVNAAIRLNDAVAGGWFSRAERLLEGVPPGPSHGLLAALGALVAVLHGDLGPAIEYAEAAQQIGEAAGDLDSQALGRVVEGWARVRTGEVAIGLALVDESMVSAVAGELSPYVTGLVYCRTLCACLDLMDYERAVRWSDEIDRLRASGGPSDLPGDCGTHRAVALMFSGDWTACEEQAALACEVTETFDLTHQALALATLGTLALGRDDLVTARKHLEQAQQMGASPHPALALLRLAEGDVDAAAAEIAAQVTDAAEDPLVRARLLPAVVEIAIARDELEDAGIAATDLADIADRFGSSALHAEAQSVRGRMLLAEGDAGGAARTLRAAIRRWRKAGSRHRVATEQLALAEALHSLGRTADAAVEAAAAEETLRSLGAVSQADRAKAVTA